jgi:peptide/nickel transport system substrate-binding protein
VDINDNPYNMNPPVSSGVWTLQEWVKGSHAIFAANERYWGGRANLDTYVFKIVQDQTAAYTQFRTGDVDTVALDPPQFDETLKGTNTTAYRYFVNGAAWDYIGFNLRDPRFQDLRVRQAFSHAMNRSQMIDTIRQGFSRPQYSIFPVTSPVFADDVVRYDYDPQKSKELLKDAGWAMGASGTLEKDGKPFEVRLYTNTGNKRREQIATRGQEYLREVGVKADIISEEFASLQTRMNKDHDFDLVIGGWTGGVEPNGQANVWKKDSPQNAVGYDNPAVERLFAQGASECTMDARRPYYEQIQSTIAAEAPYIFLWTNENTTGMSKRVQGAQPGPLPLRWNVHDWFIQ